MTMCSVLSLSAHKNRYDLNKTQKSALLQFFLCYNVAKADALLFFTCSYSNMRSYVISVHDQDKENCLKHMCQVFKCLYSCLFYMVLKKHFQEKLQFYDLTNE